MSEIGNGNGATGEAGLAAFDRLLDAFGADADRWPADRRVAAEALLQRSDRAGKAARRALAEARALDRVLAAAPAIESRRIDALAARIAAEVGRQVGDSKVVALAPVRRRAPSLAQPVTVQRRHWTAAAMLAASLLVGIVIGPGSTGLPALRDVAEAIGLGGYVDQLALAPVEDEGAIDEDVL